jgi:hypothetical protein
MEEVNNTNNEKKQNVFKRFGAWYKAKYEAHPVATITLTALTGTAVVGGGIAAGVAIHKALKPVETTAENVDLIGATAESISPIAYDLPDELGFDTVKIVNGAGEVLADAADMGGDYIVADHFNIDNVKKVIEAAAEVADTASEVVAETVIDG